MISVTSAIVDKITAWTHIAKLLNRCW